MHGFNENYNFGAFLMSKSKDCVVISGKSYLSLDKEYRFTYEEAHALVSEYKVKLMNLLFEEKDEIKKSQIRYMLDTLRVEFYKEH